MTNSEPVFFALKVDSALAEFDADGSGKLEFTEFLEMLCTSEEFKFQLTGAEKEEMLALASNRPPR